MTDDILVQRDAPIATITINRPAQRNAVSYVMWLELSQLLESLDADPDVRAVVITGAGDRAFSAGADISDFDEHRADGTKAKAYNEAVDKVLAKLADMRTPTISMIRGFAVGGGCELAVATDLRVASEDSRFGIPAARLGITIGHQEMQGWSTWLGKAPPFTFCCRPACSTLKRPCGWDWSTRYCRWRNCTSTPTSWPTT